MLKYEVTVGVVGQDILLEDGLTHHDYSGFLAERWTLNGILSRATGPALTIFQENNLAYVSADNTLAEFWFKDGRLHSSYGSAAPAYVVRDPEYLYEESRDYEDGVLHNESGAAIRNQFEHRYFLRGVEFSKEEFQEKRGAFPPVAPPPRPL